MALIKCPECAHEVSDQAASCPQCGYPIRRTNATFPASAGASELDTLVRRALIEKGKIAAIKLYRDCKPESGLAAAKEYVDRIEGTLPPDMKAHSKSSGCFGLLVSVVAGVVILCSIWSLK